MACQCSIVYGKEASRAVLDFSTVGQLEKVSLTGSANGARLSYSLILERRAMKNIII